MGGVNIPPIKRNIQGDELLLPPHINFHNRPTVNRGRCLCCVLTLSYPMMLLKPTSQARSVPEDFFGTHAKIMNQNTPQNMIPAAVKNPANIARPQERGR